MTFIPYYIVVNELWQIYTSRLLVTDRQFKVSNYVRGVDVSFKQFALMY